MSQIQQTAVKSFNDSFIIFDDRECHLSPVIPNLVYNPSAPAFDAAAQRLRVAVKLRSTNAAYATDQSVFGFHGFTSLRGAIKKKKISFTVFAL